ncbi:MAG: response regulator [Rickettsiales bacterium]|nr:response regulator [Rickettsiales bacterium]
MKIISENTEKIILTNLNEISKDVFGWRAVHIKTSINTENHKENARKTLESLTKIFSSVEAQIYLFSDYEIICFYKGIIITKINDNIVQSLRNINPELSFNDASKLVNFYDLEKNSLIIKSIVNKKIQINQLEAEVVAVNAKEEQIVDFSNVNEFDAELIKTIQSRRNKSNQLKILLVEDDAFSRRLVKNILQKEYEVIEAENAKDAYFKYINFAPHIVFMDINLPDCSGMKLLDSFNNIDNDSFVVMLSGNAYKENIVNSVQKGAKGFVAKPFPKEKIFGYLEKYKVTNN